MPDKKEILAKLDALLDGLNGTSRTSRALPVDFDVTGSPYDIDFIENNDLLPVLPVKTENNNSLRARTARASHAHARADDDPFSYPIHQSKITGITGITGSDNDFNDLQEKSREVSREVPGIHGKSNDFKELECGLSGQILPRIVRKVHKFRVNGVKSPASARAADLCGAARSRGVVLVADGLTLIVVEPATGIEAMMLREFREHAGEIIAQLRGEHRGRVGNG